MYDARMTAHSPPVKKYWTSNQEVALRDAVEWLLANRGPNGWEMTRHFQLSRYVVDNALKLPDACVGWSPALRILGQLARNDERSFDAFVTQLHDAVSEALKAEATASHRWTLLAPLEFSNKHTLSEPLSVKVLGTVFELRNSENFISEVLQWAGDVEPREHDVVFNGAENTLVTFESPGISAEAAFRNAQSAFDVLRGALEMVAQFGFSTFRFGPPKASSAVPHPRVVLCRRASGGPAELLKFLLPERGERKLRVPSMGGDGKFATAVAQVCQYVADSPNAGSSVELLADLYRLYGQAMDEERPHARLLTMWQLAEAVTLGPEDHGEGAKVVKRLSAIHKRAHVDPHPHFEVALQCVMMKRHDVVHRGLYNHVTDEDVNLLKEACENGINWLIGVQSRLPTRQHILEYWKLHTVGEVTLSRTTDVIKLVTEELSDRNN